MKRNFYRVRSIFSIALFIPICLLLGDWKYTNDLVHRMDLSLYLANSA